ncbi:MAG: DUF4012 domain-containing protein [Candidatus Buchananbacteria bacterium]|nr:DUF4012 domain-containing protein [Candidatus Buchananbacteria bacterium]
MPKEKENKKPRVKTKKSPAKKTIIKKTRKKVEKQEAVDILDSIQAINDSLDHDPGFKSVEQNDLEFFSHAQSLNSRAGADFVKDGPVFAQLSLVWLAKLILKPFRFSFKNFSQPQFKKEEEKIKEEFEDIFAAPDKIVFLGFKLPKKINRSVLFFLVVAIVLVLPFEGLTYYQHLKETKTTVLANSQDAFVNLVDGQKALADLDFNQAKAKFTQANHGFSTAKQKIQDINWLAEALIKFWPKVNNSLVAGNKLLAAAQIFSNIGLEIADTGQAVISQDGRDYYQSLVKIDDQLSTVSDDFNQAKSLLTSVDQNSLPANYQAKFAESLALLPKLDDYISQARQVTGAALKMLGQDQWQRYLLVFTNNNEMRAVGGFMGSFALLDVDQGKIKNLEVPSGGTYDVQGQLVPRLIAPKPLQLINDRWEFQDANWWPDFPTSARKIEWFYQNAGGPSSDGVILMTANMMSRIIGAIGPIEMPEYQTTVTGDNFASLTQSVIRETRDDKITDVKPKQFLTDLTPKIMDKIFSLSGDQAKQMVSVLQQGLNEKELIFYFNNPQLESVALNLGWSGQVKSTDDDYLMVVQTNLAGGKTDQVISQKINHQVAVDSDGSITDTVTLTRIHNGPNDGNIFTGVQNNSYVRFYVPTGSQLISAVGFEKPAEKYFQKVDSNLKPDVDLVNHETNYLFDQKTGTDIYQESGKTVFGNWLMIKPGQTKTAVIKYRLPFKLKSQDGVYYYGLLAQKQSGAENTTVDSQISLPPNFTINSTFPAGLPIKNNSVDFSAPLNIDQYYGLTIKPLNAN